ncbi:MAG: hypothetical protein JXR37_08940 [Kiritimatiellae bacterium]|nr:hypothetical protein [Kiritimatiellia bacterium]
MSARIGIYRSKRFLQEKLGALGFWGGALLLLVDMTTPFPTPVRGAYAMWWLLVVGAGGAAWILSRRIPVEETLQLAEESGGALTIPVVSRELGLPVKMASCTLRAMCDCGEAEEVETGQSRTWFFFNTNHGNGRLTRALDFAQRTGGQAKPAQLVGLNIARDLSEAEAMLNHLARKGYVADWKGQEG